MRFEDKKGAEAIYIHAQKDCARVVEHDDSLQVKHDQTIEITHNRTATVRGKSTTEAMQSIELKVGANSIVIDQSGITLKGLKIKLEGTIMTHIQAPMVLVKADGMLTLKGGLTMIG